MGTIADNVQAIRTKLPEGVHLVVVTKFHPETQLQEVYEAGVRDFGENLVQEMIPKAEHLPKDIRWHFIGGLQRNKVKQIVPVVSMIHSVDSIRLFDEVLKRCEQIDRVVDILLEVRIAREETKGGIAPEELDALTLYCKQAIEQKPFVRIRGLMGMASLTDDQQEVRREFALLKRLFVQQKEHHFANDAHFDTLSMGMSNDWSIAVEEGRTLIRVGTAIMGPRNY